MIVDLHDTDGEPIAVDLSDLKTIEPQGPLTALVFADGTRVVVRDEVASNGVAVES